MVYPYFIFSFSLLNIFIASIGVIFSTSIFFNSSSTSLLFSSKLSGRDIWTGLVFLFFSLLSYSFKIIFALSITSLGSPASFATLIP